MRRRWWIWAFALCCLLAVGLGLLGRGKDPYGPIRALHPFEAYVDIVTTTGRHESLHYFRFTQPYEDVRGRVMSLADVRRGTVTDKGLYFETIAGKLAVFQHVAPPAGPRWTCQLNIREDEAPWLQKTWLGIKQRLGLN